MRPDDPHRLGWQKGAGALQQGASGRAGIGDIAGQRRQKEQERKKREDEVVADCGRAVANLIVLILMVEALTEAPPVQPYTPQQLLGFLPHYEEAKTGPTQQRGHAGDSCVAYVRAARQKIGGPDGRAEVLQDVESVASIRARAEQRLDKHQRMMEVLTAALGRPRTVYVTLSIVVGWVAFNLVTPKLFGWQRIDPPPFFWLQGMVALSALLMTTLVLITANRQTRNAEERSHLDLQVNLLAEHKVAKLIALVEELRRDLPMVRDRIIAKPTPCKRRWTQMR